MSVIEILPERCRLGRCGRRGCCGRGLRRRRVGRDRLQRLLRFQQRRELRVEHSLRGQLFGARALRFATRSVDLDRQRLPCQRGV